MSLEDSIVAPDADGFYNFDDNYGDGHCVTRKPMKLDDEVDEEARLKAAQAALVNADIRDVELQIGAGNGISREIFGVVFQTNVTGLLGRIIHEADEDAHPNGGVIYTNREFSNEEIVEAVKDLLQQTYDNLVIK